jgi:hypothetical protein
MVMIGHVLLRNESTPSHHLGIYDGQANKSFALTTHRPLLGPTAKPTPTAMSASSESAASLLPLTTTAINNNNNNNNNNKSAAA